MGFLAHGFKTDLTDEHGFFGQILILIIRVFRGIRGLKQMVGHRILNEPSAAPAVLFLTTDLDGFDGCTRVFVQILILLIRVFRGIRGLK